jgi:PIN domain nuclease of toxin-antitoxin system
MRLLLDTHVVLWALADPDELRDTTRGMLALGSNEVFVSAASVWEVAIKRALGHLSIDGSLVDSVTATGFHLLSIATEHAERAGSLPMLHRDPFDRMLVAQAQVEGLTIVTRDAAIERYEVPVSIA